MKFNNRSRFLFESALYLDLHPARAFRKLCAEVSAGRESFTPAACH